MATSVYNAVKYLRLNILRDTSSSATVWDDVVPTSNGVSLLRWDNEELAAYIDEAQNLAVRSIGGILDFSSTYDISLVAGTSEYALSEKVLDITANTLLSTGKSLAPTAFNDIAPIS